MGEFTDISETLLNLSCSYSMSSCAHVCVSVFTCVYMCMCPGVSRRNEKATSVTDLQAADLAFGKLKIWLLPGYKSSHHATGEMRLLSLLPMGHQPCCLLLIHHPKWGACNQFWQ